MDIKIIKTEEEYKQVLEYIDKLVDCPENSKEEELLELLALLVDDYEQRMNYTIPAPNAIKAIKIRMEKQNLKPKDMVGIIGDKPAVSKVLSGKKKLTLPMIKRIHQKLKIPYQVLIS
jgi:HTH-type transcriptional regulator/antitoxin HigA